ncbi:MAG: metallophosphoesterase, partial [Eubacteriales bacterium]
MKQLTSFLLVFALLLSMMPAVFAAGPAEDATSAPDKIDSTTVWRYLDDNTDPAGNPEEEGYDRTGWTAVGFDDSAWKTASGSFGAKNGGAYNSSTDVLLEGCPGTADNYPTYYFRTTVTVADAGAVTKITGSISYDDAAIIYINGIKAAAFNEDGITGNNSYCTNKANTTDAFEITDAGVLSALVNGENVVAVELHNQYQNSSDIWFAMPDMTFSAEPLPATDSLLDGKAQWKYLDDNTDPAAGSDDRTGWTVETFDTTGWKTAIGPFGSKKGAAVLETGYTANTVLDGCNGSSDTPAYFFRTTFTVDSLDGMTKLNGSLQYDDGAIVYINGRRVAAFDDNACDAGGNSLNKGFDANLQYGGSNAGTPKTVSFELLDLSILHVGENTIAVELHNGRATSSDVWFHLTDLSLSDEEVIFQTNISLSVGADESRMNFTWYSVLNNAALTVADNAAMTGAQTVEADTSVANDGLYSCKATATGLNANTTYYYQLSNNGNRSAVYSFTTGGTGAFSFAFVGDPQIGAGSSTTNDAEGWENTLNIIAGNDIFSDVSFLMSAGDQVNTAADENQYDGYLDHDVLTGLPVATAIGNHDSGSNAYGQHFHVPNESEQYGVTAAGGDYYFVYNNALFLVLNSNDQTADGHKAFMELAIEATKDKDIRWKIVMFHHTLFTVANHAHDGYIDNEDGFKNAIIPVLQEMDVDVVLQGHDHVYCRTYMMDGKTPITQSEKYEYDNGTEQAPTAVHDPNGILYVTANSASGSKTYPIRNETFDFSAVQNQDNKGNVSKVTVSDKQFTITTYCVSDMSVVDSFTIKRDGSEAQPAKLLIDQVYGGGSKGDTPIANSFIELYNPTGAAVDLGSYSLVYGDKTLTLNGTIPANGSYLIVGAKETTTD